MHVHNRSSQVSLQKRALNHTFMRLLWTPWKAHSVRRGGVFEPFFWSRISCVTDIWDLLPRYTRTCTHTHTYSHTHRLTLGCINIRIQIYTYAYTYTCAYTHTSTSAYRHTHTHFFEMLKIRDVMGRVALKVRSKGTHTHAFSYWKTNIHVSIVCMNFQHQCHTVVLCAAACCSVLQRVAACCSVLQHVAVADFSICTLLTWTSDRGVLAQKGQYRLQCVAVCYSMLQWQVASSTLCSPEPQIEVCSHKRGSIVCSMLQRGAVCCSVKFQHLHCAHLHLRLRCARVKRTPFIGKSSRSCSLIHSCVYI